MRGEALWREVGATGSAELAGGSAADAARNTATVAVHSTLRRSDIPSPFPPATAPAAGVRT
jgi:hypothetical protein